MRKNLVALLVAGLFTLAGCGGGSGAAPSDMVQPPPMCPEGQIGTPPNCTMPEPETCPAGQVGTPPNCAMPEPETCPAGQVGTPPNCAMPEPETCPAGQVGTPPNCAIPEPELSFDEQTRETLQSLIDASDTVTDASVIDGNSYLWSATSQPTPPSLTVGHILRGRGEFESAGNRHGVSLAVARSESLDTFYNVDYGGWLDRSFLFVASTLTRSGDLLHPSETVGTATYSSGIVGAFGATR